MATWKKLVLSGSNISQLNNDSGYLISTSTGVNLGGAFSGSFQGNGSGLTNVAASSTAQSLTDGNGIADFTFNGSAPASVTVELDGSTLSLGSGGVKVAAAGITPVEISSSIAGGGIAGGDGTSLSVDVDNSTIGIIGGTGAIKVKTAGIGTNQIATSLGLIDANSFTGSFSGSFKGDVDIDLADLIAGNGLSGTAYDGNVARTFSVQADSTTGGSVKPVTVGSNGVGFDIRLVTGSGIGITSDKLVAAVDGTTVNVTSDTISVLKVPNALTVDNSTLQLSTGDATYDGSVAKIISVKDGGTTNAKLANDGLMLGTTDISLGATGSTVAGLTLTSAVGSGSFSGSFFGDGSGLTGIGGTLTVDGDSGTENVTLTTDDLQIITDDANEIFTAVTKDGTDVKVKIGLPDNVVIGQDLTVTRDLTVNRDLTVAGTASFQHTENLEVKDRFVRFASGSNAAGDGGFVVQQASNGTGDVFGFDGNSTSRWGVAQNFDGSESVFTPAAFMASVIVGSGTDPDATAARYDQKGNIFIGTDENIYIYS